MSIMLPVYEEVGDGVLESRGEHEFGIPPARHDLSQVTIDEHFIGTEPLHTTMSRQQQEQPTLIERIGAPSRIVLSRKLTISEGRRPVSIMT